MDKVDNLPEHGCREVNVLNSQLVQQLKSADTAFSLGMRLRQDFICFCWFVCIVYIEQPCKLFSRYIFTRYFWWFDFFCLHWTSNHPSLNIHIHKMFSCDLICSLDIEQPNGHIFTRVFSWFYVLQLALNSQLAFSVDVYSQEFSRDLIVFCLHWTRIGIRRKHW